jgi:membrane peptidoglycan carboxypeptidase
VGYTPHLSTAVWIGDPDGYTPMTRQNTPEFYGDGGLSAELGGVQGGTFPSRIWEAFMTPALYGRPLQDWPAPPPPSRPPMRLYLPGVDCPRSAPAPSPSGPRPANTQPAAPAEPEAPAAPEQPAPEQPAPEEPQEPAGFRAPHGFAAPAPVPPVPVPTLAPPPPEPPAPPVTDAPVEQPPPETAPPVPEPVDTEPVETRPPQQGPRPSNPAPVNTVVVQGSPTDTTIPPNVLDPRAPLPMVDTRADIARCAGAPVAPPKPR